MMNSYILTGRFNKANYFNKEEGIGIVTVKVTDSEDSTLILPVNASKDLYNIINENVIEDDLIGIKGFISIKNNKLELIASKITFLSQVKERYYDR